MNKHSDRILGATALLLVAAVMWYAMGFWVALVLVVWLIVLRALVVYLLSKESRLAKTGAMLLMPTTVFLFFPSKRVKEIMKELRNRERQKT